MPQRTPPDVLLDELQRLADELDRTPRKRDMNAHGEFSAPTFQKRFGSWSAAIEEAGLEAHGSGRHSDPTDDDLRAELRRLADDLGDAPTKADMNEHGAYSYAVYNSRFDSWAEAVRQAGLEPQRESGDYPTQISDADLIAELQRLADELGETPSSVDMQHEGDYSNVTYTRRFGSWSEALDAAGLGE